MLKQSLKYLSLGTAVGFALAAVPQTTAYSPFGGSEVMAQQQENKQKTRKVPAMTLNVHKRITKAQEAMDVQDFVTGEQILRDLLENKRVNEYEQAVVWQLLASIAFERDDTPSAIKAFEQILVYRESIPVALELNITFTLAQLYYSIEDYKRAMAYVERWEPQAEVVGVSQLVFISQLHYVQDDFNKALEYIYRAISDAEAVDTVEVKENWYNLAMSCHWELNQYDKVRDVLETLVITWPKPLYWTQLAGVYGELGQEQTSFSLTEAAYKQGFLDENPSQIVNVAQIMVARDAPIKATWVMEKALKEGLIEDDGDNARLLGQAYLRASEFGKAIVPLKKAASEKGDASLWFQVAQVEIQLEMYDKAVVSLEKTIKAYRKAGLKKNRGKIVAALIQQGSAYTELTEFDKAKKTFAAARKISDSRRERNQIGSWESYMKAEKAREDLLASARAGN